MSRKQFEQVVASAPRQALMITKNEIVVPSLAVGQITTVDMFAPVGSVGRLQGMYIMLEPPAWHGGAISGNHDFVLTTAGNAAGSFIAAQAAFDKSISFNRLHFYDPLLRMEPNDVAAVVAAVKDVYFDSVIGMRLHYTNNTDKAITNFPITWNVNWIKIEAA